MIIALFGGDEARIRARLHELRDEADGGSGMLESNLNTIDGRDAKPADILAAVMSVPFLSAKRLVVVENLLQRYERRYEARSGPRGGRSLGPLQPLFEALAGGIPETTILVFVGLPFEIEHRKTVVSKTNPVVQEIAKLLSGTVEEYRAPDARSLPAYIEKEAQARGLRFRNGRQGFGPGDELPAEQTPATLLAALTDGNTLAIANELDKLALYTGGGDVTLADVYRVCAGERVAGQFALADALLDGNLTRALEIVKMILVTGQDEAFILYEIASSYRRLAPVIELVAEGASTEEIASAMGNAGRYPGLRDAAIRRARRIGIAGLRAAFEALVAADRDSKSGLVDREIALEITIARLCVIGQR